MELQALRCALDFDYAYPALEAEWAESLAHAPRGARLAFLDPEGVGELCRLSYLSDEARAAFASAARRVAASASLSALAWHCYYQLFCAQSAADPSALVPMLSPALGLEPGALRALVALSGVPAMRRAHAARGVDEAITRATLGDLALWIEEYRKGHGGGWGLEDLAWLTNHLSGRLYRVGRLQFMARQFGGALVAWSNRQTGAVCALSAEGVRYRPDGMVDTSDSEGAWTATLRESEGAIEGHWISPDGVAHAKAVRLETRAWRRALDAASTVLDMHIPAGSPMDFDACGASVRDALAFFRKHFPEKTYVGIQCFSWLFDRQLPDFLPSDSNIVRYLKEFYLFPIASDARQACERVFGRYPLDLASAPRATSLQRALLAHLEAGGELRKGGCFLLADDLEWGSQTYRRKAWRLR